MVDIFLDHDFDEHNCDDGTCGIEHALVVPVRMALHDQVREAIVFAQEQRVEHAHLRHGIGPVAADREQGLAHFRRGVVDAQRRIEQRLAQLVGELRVEAHASGFEQPERPFLVGAGIGVSDNLRLQFAALVGLFRHGAQRAGLLDRATVERALVDLVIGCVAPSVLDGLARPELVGDHRADEAVGQVLCEGWKEAGRLGAQALLTVVGHAEQVGHAVGIGQVRNIGRRQVPCAVAAIGQASPTDSPGESDERNEAMP